MNTQDFTTAFSVPETPEAVFDAVNNVRGWWSGEIDGATDRLDSEFTYRYKNQHRSTQRIVDFAPGKRVAWRVLDSSLAFTSDPGEWNGSEIVFEIVPERDGTALRFTHRGLVPQNECYTSCSNAWGRLINGNLRQLIATGERQPDVFA